jgi:hypothetical protein
VAACAERDPRDREGQEEKKTTTDGRVNEQMPLTRLLTRGLGPAEQGHPATEKNKRSALPLTHAHTTARSVTARVCSRRTCLSCRSARWIRAKAWNRRARPDSQEIARRAKADAMSRPPSRTVFGALGEGGCCVPWHAHQRVARCRPDPVRGVKMGAHGWAEHRCALFFLPASNLAAPSQLKPDTHGRARHRDAHTRPAQSATCRLA